MIDFRSDTVTKPTDKMRKAMAGADVGDDVYGDDPTVNRLEKMTAEIMGFESALFTSSGTQANFVALLSHCSRGDEYIVGQDAHTYRYEAGGAAVFGSIQPQPIEFEIDGTLDLLKVSQKIKPDDIHFARTRLLCLENTHAGKVLPLSYLEKAGHFADEHNLKHHLDGARIFNASVQLGVDVKEITQHFDSSTVCLSKGLCAPVGSLVCGKKEFVDEARKWRKMAGGGMRQAGILAAAGVISLSEMVERLGEDHKNALYLSDLLSDIEEIMPPKKTVYTNMVFINMDIEKAMLLADNLKRQGVLITPDSEIRFVIHNDISLDDIRYTVSCIKSFFK